MAGDERHRSVGRVTTWRRRIARRLPWLRSAYAYARKRLQSPRMQEYAIAVYCGENPWSLGPVSGIRQPVLTRHQVTDVPAAFVADPFMLRHDASWHMYFEVMRADTGLGEIGVASSPDGYTWSYGGIVLAEPFHLSYPYVFESDGEHYMIPETGAASSVRLYRARALPSRWTFEAELLSGAAFLDASVFRHDDRWWMLTEATQARVGLPRPPRYGTLRLYGAHELRGPWEEHPMSPVVAADPSIARPAGRVITTDGRLVRFGQDCSTVYGEAVHAFEIEELSQACYRERLIATPSALGPGKRGWNRGGMHHVDAHRVDDGWLASVDGWAWRRT